MQHPPTRTRRTGAGVDGATCRTWCSAAAGARRARGTRRTPRSARSAREAIGRSSIPPEDDDRAVAEVAPPRDAADLRIADLGRARVAAQLADRLDDVVHA